MSKPEITIEVVSDVVCPWCYIGKRRMEHAIDQLNDQFDFKISYSPFELNPTAPEEGFNQKAYLANKFGSEERYQQITDHVTRVAASEGLSFNFSKQHISPNTRAAHRIIQLAKEDGKQIQVKEAFMKAYFEDGVDLTKKDNLIAVAVSAGMNNEKVKTLLNSDEGKAEIQLAEQINHQRGITGVPFFILNNKYGVSGAQPVETFVKIFGEIGSEVAGKGEVCDTDSKDC